jgi:hypothetical protein
MLLDFLKAVQASFAIPKEFSHYLGDLLVNTGLVDPINNHLCVRPLGPLQGPSGGAHPGLCPDFVLWYRRKPTICRFFFGV